MKDNRRSNVISIFRKNNAHSQRDDQSDNRLSENELFSVVMRKNAENEKRIKKNRSKANKSVLRSYRIKK